MAFNIVQINSNTSYSNGLPYRASLPDLAYITTYQLYANDDSLGTSEDVIDGFSGDYYFSSSPELYQFSCSDNSELDSIIVYYFPSSTSTEPSSEIVTLNGQTPVDMVNNVYRISRVAMISSTNTGDIYMTPSGTSLTSGVPSSSIHCMIKSGVGFSQQGWMYVPYSWSAYLISTSITCNSTSSNEITCNAYRLIPSGATYKVKSSTLGNTNTYSYDENVAPSISEGTIFYIKGLKSDELINGKISVTYNFVLLK